MRSETAAHGARPSLIQSELDCYSRNHARGKEEEEEEVGAAVTYIGVDAILEYLHIQQPINIYSQHFRC